MVFFSTFIPDKFVAYTFQSIVVGDDEKKMCILRWAQEIKTRLLFNYERLTAKEKWVKTTHIAQLTALYFFVIISRAGNTYEQITQIKLHNFPFFRVSGKLSFLLLSFLKHVSHFFHKSRNSSLSGMFYLLRALSFAPFRHWIIRVCSNKISFHIFLICLLELVNELFPVYWEILCKTEGEEYGADLEHQMFSFANLAFYITSYLLSASVYMHCYIRSILNKVPTFPSFLQGIARTAMSMAQYTIKKK